MGRGTGSGEIAAHYSRRYAAAVFKLLGVEGGFVDDRADRGGATNFGISLRFLVTEGRIDANRDGLADFDLDMDGDVDAVDVRKLTMSGAVSLYHRCFWQRMKCETFPEPIGELLFDQGVNGGETAARKILQRAINSCCAHIAGGARLAVDGVLGSRTAAAMEMVIKHPALGMPALVEAYRAASRARYRAIVAEDPSQKRFLKGWLVRANALGREA